MIECDAWDGPGRARFILQPHRSATWRDNLWLVAAIGVVAVPIASAWAWAGYWLILPLCGLELAVLLMALYVVSHSLLAREVITVDEGCITIESGRRRMERRFELGRHWAQVVLEPGRSEWHGSRLLIRSAGQVVECGRFLTNAERAELAERLRGVVASVPNNAAVL